MRHLLAIALASCGGQGSVACEDAFCPADTVCGGAGVCLVAPGHCEAFAAQTPCQVDDRRRGSCADATCVPGLSIVGSAVSIPEVELPDVVVTVRAHPEVRPVHTNVNGFFELEDVPRDRTLLVELAYPDSITVVTRPIATADVNVFVDTVYGAIPMLTDAFLDVVAAQLGLIRIPNTAIIAGISFDPTTGEALAGVAVGIEGTTCDGPFYFDRTGMPLLGTTTDRESGVFGFANCQPGPAAVTATRAGGACRTLDASPGPIGLELIADQLAYTGRVVCD